MIPQSFEYTAAKTVDEVVGLLGEGAKALAGGMSLIPAMKLRLSAPEHLVDLGRLKDLRYIREEGGALHIGAMTTHHEVANSTLVRAKCPLLAETAGQIGDVQVRNMGTIGGSSAHNDPSADYPAALQALEARFVLKSAKGERTITAAELFVDTFTTSLNEGELIREVIVPTGDTGYSYQKCAQPASGFAVVGVAVRLKKTAGKLSGVHIGVTGLSNSSFRAKAAEAALEGKAGTAEEIKAAAALVPKGVDVNSDLHASAEYRAHLSSVYARRAIDKALSRA